MKQKGFTLIELLVVIAIIAILAAILFPVFAQAKLAAKKTQSLSNGKQTTLGVLMYAGDYDDTFPIGSGYCWFYPTDGGWAWDTAPYIKSGPLLKDPSDSLGKTFWQTWFDPNATVTVSYASNGAIAWTGSTNETVGVMGMLQGQEIAGVNTRCGTGDNWGGSYGTSIVNSSRVTKPADSIMLASRFGGDNMYGGGDIMTGITDWDATGPQALPDGRRATNTPYTVSFNGSTFTVNKDQRYGAVAAPYSDQGIFTFVDGHAKTMNPIATNPNQDANPDKNMWNSIR